MNDGNPVFGSLQLRLQIAEVLTGLQIGIAFRNGHQTAQCRGKLALSLSEPGHRGRVVHVDTGLSRLRPGFDNLAQRILLVRGVAFHGIDQIRDQVHSALILVLDISQLSRRSFAAQHHVVVTALEPRVRADDKHRRDSQDNPPFSFHMISVLVRCFAIHSTVRTSGTTLLFSGIPLISQPLLRFSGNLSGLCQ